MISEKKYKRAIHEYTKSLFRFLYKSLKDEDAANDLVQDCFLKLWLNRKKVDENKVKSWLFSVAYHAMLNYVKVESRKTSLDHETDTSQVFQNNDFDLKRIIDEALSNLPTVQKSIILLRDLEGYDYKEISEMLKLSESQVKVYLFRARQKIKSSIKSLTHVL
ncbi:MAG: RNA polymerase sigma factor [Reichenbachiella sp.]